MIIIIILLLIILIDENDIKQNMAEYNDFVVYEMILKKLFLKIKINKYII